MKSVTFRIAEEDLRAIDEIANLGHITRTDLIKKVLEEKVALHRWQLEQIQEGIDDANNDRWADSNDPIVKYLLGK